MLQGDLLTYYDGRWKKVRYFLNKDEIYVGSWKISFYK